MCVDEDKNRLQVLFCRGLTPKPEGRWGNGQIAVGSSVDSMKDYWLDLYFTDECRVILVDVLGANMSPDVRCDNCGLLMGKHDHSNAIRKGILCEDGGLFVPCQLSLTRHHPEEMKYIESSDFFEEIGL